MSEHDPIQPEFTHKDRAELHTDLAMVVFGIDGKIPRDIEDLERVIREVSEFAVETALTSYDHDMDDGRPAPDEMPSLFSPVATFRRPLPATATPNWGSAMEWFNHPSAQLRLVRSELDQDSTKVESTKVEGEE